MVINNVIVQYNGGFLPDILLLTQAPIFFVWFDGTANIVYYYYHTILTMYYTVSSVLLCLVALHGD